MHEQPEQPAKTGKHLVVIGAGGNIGSHLIPHLARLPGISRVTCVDCDVYEEKNLLSQDIAPGDVGRPKAVVQARRLQRISPSLTTHAIHGVVERVPLGHLRGDLMFSCLDSKLARSYAHQFAWRLRMPFIDAGVSADGLLARVNVYVPGDQQPCMECGWGEDDYALLEQTYPCQLDKQPQTFATDAPSGLGALAASLQALEAQKLLNGQIDCAAVGREVVLNALHHKHYVTAIPRRIECRFDHEVWEIEKLGRDPKSITIGETLELGRTPAAPSEPGSLALEGTTFVTKLCCINCNKSRKVLRLHHRLSQSQRTCNCGRLMVASAFDRLERLDGKSLPAKALERSLASIGFETGDIFTLAAATGQKHYELGV